MEALPPVYSLGNYRAMLTEPSRLQTLGAGVLRIQSWKQPCNRSQIKYLVGTAR